MKIIIKLLLVLANIILSCNNLFKDVILNSDLNNSNDAGQVIKSSPAPSETSQTTCHSYNRKLKSLLRTYMDEVIAYNKINYSFKSDSQSNLYAERWSKQAKYRNKFLLFFNSWNDHSNWLINPEELIPFAIFSKSPKVISKCIQLFHINREINLDIYSNSNLLKMPPLDYAIYFGHEEMLRAIIQGFSLIDINGKSKALNLPDLLKDAIASGRKEIVRVVIDAGADPNLLYNSKKAGQSGNALMLAEIYDQKDVASYLIENNLIKDLNQENIYGQTALMRIAGSQYPGWSKIFYKLLQKGANIIKIDKDKYNVLTHLLTRFQYVHRTYKASPNNFIDGYNSMHVQAKELFEHLCNDKEEMLKFLYNDKDIKRLLDKKSIF